MSGTNLAEAGPPGMQETLPDPGALPAATTPTTPTTTPTPTTPTAPTATDRKRWLAFGVLGLATLMNVLDTTIANIALKPIHDTLGFTDAGLAWVINAYMLTFGGFLLLAGRMGDLFGSRRVFLAGLVTFTLASLGCGLAQSPLTLIVARAIQGLGAAVITAVSLALIMDLFPDGPGRAKAMGVFAFIASGGGALGGVLGGFITAHFDWHWNFLINVPIGIAVYFGTRALVPDPKGIASGRLDVGGALTVTASLLLAVYAVLQAKQDGWTSPTTLLRLAGAAALMLLFVLIERRVAVPLVPLGLFAKRNILAANTIGILWAAAMFAWFFLSSLYMQNILRYDPQRTGLAFVPADLLMAVFSIGLSARMVGRFGIRRPVALGLLLAAAGLALFAVAPADGSFLAHVLPGMLLLGIGAGMAFNPLFLAAMSDATPAEGGLASGLVNTAFMMGGALGLAVLASLAASRTGALGGADDPAALLGGYHLAFVGAALCALVAAGVGLWLREPSPGAAEAARAPLAH
ncbi:MAG TPA: MFS transporter [Candidatus Thermoplasmatota archaeon]|nr:MFS transporter [Candidatus Thermoplasmatota archaeon]